MPLDDAHEVRSGRRSTRHRSWAGVLGAVMVLALVGCDGGDPTDDARVAETAAPPSSSLTATPDDTDADATTTVTTATPPLDTSSWATYSSDRYNLAIGYPPGWTVEPAVRDWTWEVDAHTLTPEGMEGFSSPEGDIFVTVFSIPFDPDKETTADVRAWVQDYCEAGTYPCTGIDDRAVPLCVEKRDCHPGLLVPFATDVQAFFTGGHYYSTLVVASVWRNDSNITVQQRYGSFQNLLEGFLATMDVWPAPAARSR